MLQLKGEGKSLKGTSSAIINVIVDYPPQIRVRERNVHGHIDKTRTSNQASIYLSCDVKAEPFVSHNILCVNIIIILFSFRRKQFGLKMEEKYLQVKYFKS